jgi:hypothetical protein
MKWLYLGTLVLVFAISSVICYSSYQAGLEDGKEKRSVERIDQTEAYNLGWREAREIHSFMPAPDKWVNASEMRISQRAMDVEVIGILTTDPNNEDGCLAWACLKEETHPHVLKHYSFAVDEIPTNRYYYIGVWACVDPLKTIKEPENDE